MTKRRLPAGMRAKRNRRSAKAAGSRFERELADHLADKLNDDRIDRRAKTGAKDKGDIAGVRVHDQRLVIEVKNCAKLTLPQWVNEAHVEAANDNALCGIVVHKRHGVGDVGQQWVSMTVDDLVMLLTGQRIEKER